jgi:hypothetical protein
MRQLQMVTLLRNFWKDNALESNDPVAEYINKEAVNRDLR